MTQKKATVVMIRAILQLHAAPGQRDQLLAHYERNEVLDASSSWQWTSGEVGLDLTDDHTVVVTSTWPSVQNYHGWLASTARRDVLTAMQPLLDPHRPAVTQVLQLAQTRQAGVR
ncbi:hypothetical protein M1247_28835 [Mycobacterium sp. 21AC1]|uniref:antibiotic biosynthesis monooxygenase family protein n=1 Tax=[Mycobacterium] appelbergii TaxID=2939269 RepID=UPI002938F009|nr:hypothetical protein [Mycobacterium sp. 21AC1]MDV3128943.1 hypothetical protein [Mycobacterium sp. 21AC1]